MQRLKEARAASAQDSTGADGSEVPSHEVPAHPFAAAEDSKKRKLDNAASSEASQDCNTMEWLCSKCSKSFTTKFNLTRHEKNPCRVLTLHVCPGKHGEGCPAEYSTNNKPHYDDHVKVCGIGRGGKREGAGSGGKREDAKRGKTRRCWKRKRLKRLKHTRPFSHAPSEKNTWTSRTLRRSTKYTPKLLKLDLKLGIQPRTWFITRKCQTNSMSLASALAPAPALE